MNYFDIFMIAEKTFHRSIFVLNKIAKTNSNQTYPYPLTKCKTDPLV